MNTKKIFLMSALALLVCSCQDDEMTSGQPTATPGEEVQFGGSLGDGATTRTIYGQENANGFPIYWVNGDQVLVASPECGTQGGVGSATYAVSVDGPQQNYATSMDKTGDIGVRWGENTTGTFYSVYPAARHTAFNDNLTSARLTVTTQQDNTWNPEDNTVQPAMNACFMWAKTENVSAGEDVNLAYKPLSTAVRFTVTGPQSGEPVTISYIRLYAPNNVALSGTFNVDFTNINADGMPAVSAVSGQTFNYASMNAATSQGSYLTLEVGETAQVQLFFLLENAITMDENWSIVIATADGRLFTKNITANEGGNLTLKPGQIHKIDTPLPPLSEAGEWDPSTWMKNIQRNVYLSEISIPGSWNSLNHDFQGSNPSITAQYNAGVRAFHLDTRWIARNEGYIIPDWQLTGDLGIANGGTTHDMGGLFEETQNTMVEGTCPTFAEALAEITNNVKDDEYMVLYCTFAQGSYIPDDHDWRQAIAEACEKKSDKVIDARNLDENSTVADVEGRVIVVVSTMYHDTEVQSRAFYTDLRYQLDASEFTSASYFTKPLFFNNNTLNASGIDLYATYAQITHSGSGTGSTGDRGYEPTLNERQTKCENLLDWSQKNYNTGDFQHNAWIFMGLGGYVDDGGEDYSAVNNQLIPWLNGKLTEMETVGAYYPVGIVFMNDVVNARQGNNVTISNTVEDILLLNNRYRKAYDPDRSPVDGSQISGGGSTVNSVAPGYSSGMTDNGTEAIGW